MGTVLFQFVARDFIQWTMAAKLGAGHVQNYWTCEYEKFEPSFSPRKVTSSWSVGRYGLEERRWNFMS